MIVGFVSVLMTGAGVFYLLRQYQTAQTKPTSLQSPQMPKTVVALGRLEPQGEVIRVSAPSSTDGSNRVAQLLVEEGNQVKAGQTIAVLDSRDTLQAALREAQQQVSIARARLAQIKVGAKIGEIEAQQAAIKRLEIEQRREAAAQAASVERLEAEVRNAQLEDLRYQMLYQEGAVSTSNRDSKFLTVETFQQQLNEAQANLSRIVESRREQIREAKATLNRIAEVRPVDVAVAQAEVDGAIAAVERVQAQLDLAYVRAPKAGQILKIHTHSGETVAGQGIVEMGQTSQMYAVAEVYETDIGKVRLGQKATIISDAVAEKLWGTVTHIGLQVHRQDVFDTNPTTDADARIIEVKIRLNEASSRKVSSLSNQRVRVALAL